MKFNFYKIAGKFIIYFALIIFLILALFPIYWMINTSFKNDGEIYNIVPTFWPHRLYVQGYVDLIMKTSFLIFLKNSIFVSTAVTVISVFMSMLAAYAIARIKFTGRSVASKGIFYAYLMPKTLMYIPLYMLVNRLGLTDSLTGLILIYPTIVIPYSVWMLISYFESIPYELEEASFIDGCTQWQSMFKIIFPVAIPGIVSTLIIAFTLCWSDYLYAMVNIISDHKKTISVGLADMVTDDIYAWGKMAAGAVFSSVPILFLYIFANKYVESGLTSGAIKG
jgi:multiple sugar transport system permease protein